MTELMAHVERAVRPVRAGVSRKLKMREELLAHLTAIYDEERARLGDDADAVREALRRFGEPAALTKELQATVPGYERFLAMPLTGSGWERRTARWFHPRPNEGAVRHAARLAAFFAGYTLAILTTAAVFQSATGVVWSPFRANAAAAAVVTAHAFASAMLCVGFFRAASGRLTRRALLMVVACGAPLLAAGPALFAALKAVQPDNPLWGSDLFNTGFRPERLIPAGIFWLAVGAVFCRFVSARNQRITPWLELKIDG